MPGGQEPAKFVKLDNEQSRLATESLVSILQGAAKHIQDSENIVSRREAVGQGLQVYATESGPCPDCADITANEIVTYLQDMASSMNDSQQNRRQASGNARIGYNRAQGWHVTGEFNYRNRHFSVNIQGQASQRGGASGSGSINFHG